MKRKKAYPTNYFIRFFTYLFLQVFTKYYRIQKKLPLEVKQLKGPYLMLSNHVGFWDPFVAGHFLPQFTHFVASDAAFRNGFNRFFLKGLGAIPKKKNIRDAKVIRDIMTVMNQGENVGLFPEAVRNWSGKSFPIDPSIAKLIKKLNAPVIVGLLQGMNLFNPRWSGKLRRTYLNVDYSIALSKKEVQELSVAEIYSRISQALDYDEVAFQKSHMHPVRSNHKAEEIGHALFVCPQCEAIDSFEANQNEFGCKNCDYTLVINAFGFYELKSGAKLFFDNIRDWYNWQEEWLLNFVADKYDILNDDEVILEDKGSSIYYGNAGNEIHFVGKGDVRLYRNRIEIVYQGEHETVELNFYDLQTINPQLHERLELFYNNEAYRIVGGRKGVSALKWEVAVNAIWQKMGIDHKLSPYIGKIENVSNNNY